MYAYRLSHMISSYILPNLTQHTVYILAWNYTAWNMGLRNSKALVKVAAFSPSGIDHSELLTMVLWVFRRLEGGYVCRAAVEGGEAIIKGSVYHLLGDSPQQAATTYTKGPSATRHCPVDIYTSDTTAFSDEVGVSSLITFRRAFAGQS